MKRDATNVHSHDFFAPSLGERLVDVEDRLRRKLPTQFVVGGAECVRHGVLQLDRQSSAARLPQDCFEKQRRAAFALTEAGHQQSSAVRRTPSVAARSGQTAPPWEALRRWIRGSTGIPTDNDRYSMMSSLISGNSQTLCRSATRSRPDKARPQRRQPPECNSTTRSHCSTEISGRSHLACPGCPPRFRFDFAFGGAS